MDKRLLYILLLGFITAIYAETKDSTIVSRITLLKTYADKLLAKADHLQKEANRHRKERLDLEQTAEQLEEHAVNLIRLSRRINRRLKSPDPADSTLAITIKNEDLLDRMRNSADSLLVKSQQIAIKVRQLGEQADQEADLADKMREQVNFINYEIDSLNTSD